MSTELGWSDPDRVDWYLSRIDKLGARRAGEQMLVDVLPESPRAALDLGCGDGRLCDLLRRARPSLETIVGVDNSSPMLERARQRLYDQGVVLEHWDLNDPIASLGEFDVIVSGFAIHHLTDHRKQRLFGEIAQQLQPGGIFANLEVIQSATPERHAEFLAAVGRTENDPEDELATVEDQLGWMRDAGLSNVDCLWRWRGFALLAGEG